MTTTAKIRTMPITDEDGHNLPKNMSTQFRQVQTGLEFLKEAADNVTTELKGVNHKLKLNTTDLGEITKKVNAIDLDLKKHIKVTNKNFKNIEKMNQAMYDLLKVVYTNVATHSDRLDNLES